MYHILVFNYFYFELVEKNFISDDGFSFDCNTLTARMLTFDNLLRERGQINKVS